MWIKSEGVSENGGFGSQYCTVNWERDDTGECNNKPHDLGVNPFSNKSVLYPYVSTISFRDITTQVMVNGEAITDMMTALFRSVN